MEKVTKFQIKLIFTNTKVDNYNCVEFECIIANEEIEDKDQKRIKF
jgi:hypothetical protein